MQILKVGAVARTAHLLSPGVLEQRIDLDDVGTPVRKLPYAGGTRTDAGEIEPGEARQGLRSTRDGHSGHSRRDDETGIGDLPTIDNPLMGC